MVNLQSAMNQPEHYSVKTLLGLRLTTVEEVESLRKKVMSDLKQ